MIRFRCKECGKKLKADEEIIGKKVKCTRCDNVETVPPLDDLTQPKPALPIPTRLAINKPLPLSHSGLSNRDSLSPERSDSDSFDEGLLLGDDMAPLTMAGPSGSGTTVAPTVDDSIRQPFKLRERKKSDFQRLLPIAVIGFAFVGIVMIAISSGWIFNSRQKFDPEFEALPAVANYRRAQNQLEKSRRVMMVMGEALISQKTLSEELIDELNEFNDSILTLSRKTKTLVEAAKLVDQDAQGAANKLLTDEAKLMDDRKFDVDRKTEQYNKLSYKS